MTNHFQPVFIVGAPRSGTTMLAAALGEHPDVLVLPELHFLRRLVRYELVWGRAPDQDWIKWNICNDPRFIDLFGRGHVPDENSVVFSGDAAQIMENVVSRYNGLNAGKDFSVWVEHTPRNVDMVPLLKYRFPCAKFIHSVRDGRAVYASLRKTPWGAKDPVTGARIWRSRLEAGLPLEKIYEGSIRRTHYEELVSDFPSEAQAICEFIGITFNSDMERGGGLVLPSWSQSQRKIGRGVVTSSRDKWRTELSDLDIRLIESECGPFLTRLGYPCIHDMMAEKPPAAMIRRAKRLQGLIRKRVAGKRFARRIRKYGEMARQCAGNSDRA